jgi:hypothetical protein
MRWLKAKKNVVCDVDYRRCALTSLNVVPASGGRGYYLGGVFQLKRPEKKPSRQFSRSQARRVTDYIGSNLSGEINLFDLANLVHLSSRQFFRIFVNTFGATLTNTS